MTISKAAKIIICVLIAILFLWVSAFIADWVTVDRLNHTPIFCVDTMGDSHHYKGLGYSFDAYTHPITGKLEYCLRVFGIEIVSNFTD